MKKILPLLMSVGLAQADAQSLGFGGPVSTLVYRSDSRGITPVLGVPGGSYLGRTTAGELDWAWVSPNRKLAFGIHQGQLDLIRDPGGNPVGEDLGLPAPAMLAWSADSSAAAIYWDNENVIRTVRFVSGQVRIGEPLDLSVLPGKTVGFAVGRYGRTTVVSVKDQVAGGVYLIGRIRSSPKLLMAVADPTAPVLANNGRDLVVADRASSEIHVLRRHAYQPAVSTIAVEPAESAAWLGVTVSPDGRRILLVDRGARTATVFDTVSGLATSKIQLSFEPASIETASDEGLYLLRPESESVPLHLLAMNGEPAVYFVPNRSPSLSEE